MNIRNASRSWRRFFLKMRKILIGSLCLLAACERTALSPVEIKLDDKIGGFATVSSINNTYVVQNNETLFDIANKFNIDPMNLASVNDIKAPYNICNGQILKLPVEGEQSSSDQQQKVLYAPIELHGDFNQESRELDEKFEKMMKADEGRSNSETTIQSIKNPQNRSTSRKSNKGFEEQAKNLSAPKVTSTATGAKISKERTSPVAKPSPKEMIRPVEGKVISKFGDNLDGVPNDGINIKAPAGAPVNAVSDGEVIYAGNNLDESFGNVVVIEHKNGLVSSYAHLKDIKVRKGSKIKAGQRVGSVGKTGDVSQPQLHLEIMKNNTPENPEKYIGKI